MGRSCSIRGWCAIKNKGNEGKEAAFSLLLVRCCVTSIKKPRLYNVGNLIIVKMPTWQLMFTRAERAMFLYF